MGAPRRSFHYIQKRSETKQLDIENPSDPVCGDLPTPGARSASPTVGAGIEGTRSGEM